MPDRELYTYIPELVGSVVSVRVGRGYGRGGITIGGRFYRSGEVVPDATITSVERLIGSWVIYLGSKRCSCPLSFRADVIELDWPDDDVVIGIRKPLQRIRARYLLTGLKPLESILGSRLFGYLSKAI